jgi:putative oxidoreductase
MLGSATPRLETAGTAPAAPAAIEGWAPHLQSLARIVFGFLVLRHGMEQVLGYPEASDSALRSFQGLLEVVALPAAALIMSGLFTRPVSGLLAAVYFVSFFVGPLQRGWYTHRNGGDPILLNAFFFLYLAAAGGGAWSLDRLFGRETGEPALSDRAAHALGILRIAAGCLFVMHGLEKFFGVGGGRLDRDIMTIRGFAGLLETVGGPLLILGLLTRPTAFILSGEMAVAYFRSWAPRGFWQSFALAGMEASILFCFLFLFLWSAGPGAFSLDSFWRSKRRGGSTMKAQRTVLATISVLLLSSIAMQAQWVTRKTPGIPRLPDGTPDMKAPAPPKLPDGHPDLQGIWDVGAMTYFHDLANGLKGDDAPKLTPWAASLQKGRRDRNHVDDPYTYCLPMGVPRENMRSPFKILQTPSITVFLHESFVGNTFRQIFTDGRPLPKLSETEPAWLGYSVGRWEGDEFVVESTGFRDAGWLSANMAYPNSDALHVTERFRRIDFGHLQETVTIDDPKAYLKPWTNKITFNLQADTELLDSYCDNQQIMQSHYSMGPRPTEPHSPPAPEKK